MFKLLLFLGLICLVACAIDEDEARKLKNTIEDAERAISRTIDDTMRSTRDKVDQKIRQASRRGRSSEDCARKAGKTFMKDVQSLLDGDMKKTQEEFRELRRSIEDRTMSEEEFDDLKENTDEKLIKKMESVMTKTGAEVDGLSLDYARKANSC